MEIEEIRYYPVIDCDSDGTKKVPMMFTGDGNTVKANHSLWLMEIVPHSFRLCSTEAGLARLNAPFTISCPRCGKDLRMVAGEVSEHRHGLYVCDACRG